MGSKPAARIERVRARVLRTHSANPFHRRSYTSRSACGHHMNAMCSPASQRLGACLQSTFRCRYRQIFSATEADFVADELLAAKSNSQNPGGDIAGTFEFGAGTCPLNVPSMSPQQSKMSPGTFHVSGANVPARNGSGGHAQQITSKFKHRQIHGY